MNKTKSLKIAVFCSFLVLSVLLFILPVKPPLDKVISEKVNTGNESVDEQIQKAVDLVNGENPMEGIMLLRKLLEDDPRNAKVHFQLGLFSIRSGQLDKAEGRFKTVIELDPHNSDARLELIKVLISLNKITEAETQIKELKQGNKNLEEIEEIEKLLTNKKL